MLSSFSSEARPEGGVILVAFWMVGTGDRGDPPPARTRVVGPDLYSLLGIDGDVVEAKRTEYPMIWVRRIGSVLLAAAAVTVWFAMAPADVQTGLSRSAADNLPSTTVDRDDIAAIMTDDGLNQGTADSAPQQSVVNGWTARDLLEAIAQQGADTYRAVVAAAQPDPIPPTPERDQRPAALLVLAVIGLALAAFTDDRARARGPRFGKVAMLTAATSGAGGDTSRLAEPSEAAAGAPADRLPNADDDTR